jgi:ABC-2 type transport system permease protein
MKRFLILTKAIFLISVRNGAVLFWNFAFPVFLMLIYGLIMSDYMDYMTPGVVVLNALSFGLVGSSTAMLEMREKGILRRLQATPLPAGHLILAYLIVNMGIVLIQSAIVVVMGVVFYGVSISVVGLALGIPMILAGVFTFLALGGVVSGLAPKAGVATGAGMTVYFGLMFISDMIFPIDMLPNWLQQIVPYLPSYLVVNLVRQPLLEGVLDEKWLLHIGLLAVYAIAASVLAAKLFRWEPKA